MLLLINGRKERRCRSVGWKNRLLDWFVEDVKDGRLSAAVVGKKTTQNLMSFVHPVTIFVVSTQGFRRSQSTLGGSSLVSRSWEMRQRTQKRELAC